MCLLLTHLVYRSNHIPIVFFNELENWSQKVMFWYNEYPPLKIILSPVIGLYWKRVSLVSKEDPKYTTVWISCSLKLATWRPHHKLRLSLNVPYFKVRRYEYHCFLLFIILFRFEAILNLQNEFLKRKVSYYLSIFPCDAWRQLPTSHACCVWK
jgi:hypothetical protein